MPLHFTSSCSLLFQFFSSHSHTLPLIITFQVWLNMPPVALLIVFLFLTDAFVGTEEVGIGD